MTKTIKVYHVQFEKAGNGPVHDTIEALLEDVRDRLTEEPQGVTIHAEEWPKKRYDNLPEFGGY